MYNKCPDSTVDQFSTETFSEKYYLTIRENTQWILMVNPSSNIWVRNFACLHFIHVRPYTCKVLFFKPYSWDVLGM